MSRKKLYVVGCGPGDPELLTIKALRVIGECRRIAGSRRALETISKLGILGSSMEITRLERGFEDALKSIVNEKDESVILSTGDPMYAGLGRIVLDAAGSQTEVLIIPGVSSLQLAAARLGLDWSNTTLVDLHTRPDEKLLRYAFSEIVLGRTVAFTLHSRIRAIDIVRKALHWGYKDVRVHVCENVGRENERILTIDLDRASSEDLKLLEEVSPNTILFAVPRKRIIRFPIGENVIVPQTVPGPTKEEIRSIIAAKSGVKPGDTVLEIGCGSGAVTIELAMRVFPDGKIIAVDRKREAVEATAINASRHGVSHLIETLHGEAPDVLKNRLEDQVFQAIIIDAGKRLRENIEFGHNHIADGGRIIVVCVTMESLVTSLETFKTLGVEPSITSILVSRSRKLGSYTSLLPLNPITLVIGDVR